jgi:hypothetical protein
LTILSILKSYKVKNITLSFLFLILIGCKTSDKEIRADIAGKAQQDLNFAGLQYTVQNGIVDFTGNCPSEKALTRIRQTMDNIHVIKTVRYHVSIAPVVLDTLTPLKLQVDSLLAPYPRVIAKVGPDGATLKGEITAVEKTKLMESFQLPGIKAVIDSLSVR